MYIYIYNRIKMYLLHIDRYILFYGKKMCPYLKSNAYRKKITAIITVDIRGNDT